MKVLSKGKTLYQEFAICVSAKVGISQESLSTGESNHLTGSLATHTSQPGKFSFY
jgi:hypothetical protein